MTAPGVDVLVVATYGEAQALGARHEGSRWVMPDGRVAISVRSARVVDGLRVASVKSTSKAELVPGFDKVMATLERSQRKTRPADRAHSATLNEYTTCEFCYCLVAMENLSIHIAVAHPADD